MFPSSCRCGSPPAPPPPDYVRPLADWSLPNWPMTDSWWRVTPHTQLSGEENEEEEERLGMFPLTITLRHVYLLFVESQATEYLVRWSIKRSQCSWATITKTLKSIHPSIHLKIDPLNAILSQIRLPQFLIAGACVWCWCTITSSY